MIVRSIMRLDQNVITSDLMSNLDNPLDSMILHKFSNLNLPINTYIVGDQTRIDMLCLEIYGEVNTLLLDLLSLLNKCIEFNKGDNIYYYSNSTIDSVLNEAT